MLLVASKRPVSVHERHQPAFVHSKVLSGNACMQVMGHTKTICVLIGGALLFQELITLRVATGMSLAVIGMVGYGYFTHNEKKQGASPEKSPIPGALEKGDKGKAGDGETAVLLTSSNRSDSSGMDGLEGTTPK